MFCRSRIGSEFVSSGRAARVRMRCVLGVVVDWGRVATTPSPAQGLCRVPRVWTQLPVAGRSASPLADALSEQAGDVWRLSAVIRRLAEPLPTHRDDAFGRVRMFAVRPGISARQPARRPQKRACHLRPSVSNLPQEFPIEETREKSYWEARERRW